MIQEIDGADLVICTNCDFKGLVNLGADKCPKCLTVGNLGWACEFLSKEELNKLIEGA